MGKLGRNEPCPCGSGKKYKKCCIGKTRNFTKQRDEIFEEMTLLKSKEKTRMIDELKMLENYDKYQLLAILSYIQASPENHDKNIRLDKIKSHILNNITSKGNKIPKWNELILLFENNFQADCDEDPSENLFTQNIMSPVGNTIVFTGLAEGHVYFLQQLINVLYQGNFPNDIKRECIRPSMMILLISDLIAKRFGYNRNMLGVITESNNIYVPNESNLTTNNIRISYEEMCSITRSSNPLIILKDFLFNESKDKWDGVSDGMPIINKPLLYHKDEEEFIIISPTTIVYAALNSILKRCVINKVFDKVILEYSYNCWEHCIYMLNSMGIRQLDYTFTKSSLPLHEGLFWIDSDKVAYVSFIYDNGSDFQIDESLQSYSNSDISKKLYMKIEESHITISQDVHLENVSILNIVILLGIGRAYRLEMNMSYVNNLVILNIQELEILQQSGKCDMLTLWNFSNALKITNIKSCSFLDTFAFYINNDESFYHTDDNPCYNIFIHVGTALNFKYKAIVNADIHSTNRGAVKRVKLAAQLPVYSTKNIGLPFYTYVNCFGVDIIIEPINSFIAPKNEDQEFCSEICIAIAYWLFVLSNNTDNKICTIGSPLNIKIKCVDIMDQDDLSVLFQEQNHDGDYNIMSNITNQTIIINLDATFIKGLISDDNKAEIALIKRILYLVCEIHNDKNFFNHGNIDKMLVEFMPISQRKKLIFNVSEQDMRVSPKNIIPLRYNSKYSKDIDLNNLAEILALEKPYIPKDNLPNETKSELLNNVVSHFYKLLRDKINSYDQLDILNKLMAIYESAIQKRGAIGLHMIPEIECYKDYCNIEKHINEKQKRNNSFTVSVRCLIEHVIAEPSKGTNIISLESLDSCIAYMHHIINWGWQSDEFNFNISDPKISLLRSGRIGTSKDFQNDIMNKYIAQRNQEEVFRSAKMMELIYSLPNDQNYNQQVDAIFENSFIEEFGISIDNFRDITLLLSQEAFKKQNSICSISYNEIKNLLRILNIKDCEIATYIENFSLKDRGLVQEVKNAGKEYKIVDFFPWRFGRKLSLLLKPILISENNEEKVLLFGARALIDTFQFVLENILSGRFQAKSKSMKSYISNVNIQKGTDLNNDVYKYISDCLSDEFILEKEIFIGPGRRIQNIEDIGDIDVFIADQTNKKILCIECKCLINARTPYEMNGELQKFISGNDPWIPKVERRNRWINENKASLSTLGVSSLEEYEIEYIFLTNEVISLQFIKANELKYRFVSFIDIQKDYTCLFNYTL